MLFGAFCAAAAGAFFYMKKNNIQVEDVVRKVQDKIKDFKRP